MVHLALSSVRGNSFENLAIPVGAEEEVLGLVPMGQKNPLWFGVGSRISALRVQADLPSTTVSRFAALGKTTANKIEDMQTCPRIDIVERIATALDVSPSWIAFGHEGYEPFRKKRPRDVVPPDPPEPHAAERPATERYRGVGERCFRVRHLRGLSLRDVAEIAPITHASLHLIEKGASVPLVSTCESLAVAFGVAPGWLAYGEGQVPEGVDEEATGAAGEG